MSNELRPKRLSEVIGNDNLKECLDIIVQASKIKKKALPHIIFHGHYGCGKTTLARVLSNEIGGEFIEINGASIKKDSHILDLFPRITENSILFIDEIHRMRVKRQELLYSVMEDFESYMPTSNVLGGNLIKMDIPPFSLIGATTDLGSLSGPFLNRFRHRYPVQLYSEDDIKKMILINSKKLNLVMTDDVALEIAKRCKNVPRYANNLLNWIDNYCTVKRKSTVSIDDVNNAFRMEDIDEQGFDRTDRLYLETVARHQPVGLTNLAAAIGSTPETIVKYIEPIMLARGIIEVTREGRFLKGYSNPSFSSENIEEEISNLLS